MEKINFIILDDSEKMRDFIRQIIREDQTVYSADGKVLEMVQMRESEFLESTSQSLTVTESHRRKVTRMLLDLGVPANIKGYTYLRDAILIAAANPQVINSITKTLYPEVGKLNNTTSPRVERAMRHAIEVAWARGSNEVAVKAFGYTVNMAKGKPTNSEFIALLADKIRMNEEISHG